jgi:hypothetical protein
LGAPTLCATTDNVQVANVDEGQTPIRVTVDGELFEVAASADHPGQYHFAWLSGPNEGYGFSESRSDRKAMSEREIQESIRRFLVQVDPETGYIE